MNSLKAQLVHAIRSRRLQYLLSTDLVLTWYIMEVSATETPVTKSQWRRKLVELRGTGNKIFAQSGRFHVDVFIAYILENTGTILAILHTC